MSLKRITSVDELHKYLHAAIQLEHATFPPYLTALYSIRPQTNSDASHVLRVVLVEEMLHMTLAANLLNAVGGTPDIAYAGFVPQYPAHLPNGETDFEVGILGFSKECVETFLQIERPARAPEKGRFVKRKRSQRAVLPAYKGEDDSDLHFYSIGEFYAEIEHGLTRLQDELKKKGENLFVGDPARQVTPDYYYSGGGEVIPVVDLESAREAIRLISEQGEGLGGAIFDYEGEISHYYRFEQVMLGRYYHAGDKAGRPSGRSFEVDWDAAYPIKPNARLSDYPAGSELHAAAVAFGEAYQAFLGEVNQAFSGRPELLIDAVGGMFRIKELATQLIRNPIPGMDGVHAAPIFGS